MASIQLTVSPAFIAGFNAHQMGQLKPAQNPFPEGKARADWQAGFTCALLSVDRARIIFGVPLDQPDRPGIAC